MRSSRSSLRFFPALGAFFGLVSVAAGAFGSHVLEAKLSGDRLEIFELATRYLMVHALALLLLGALSGRMEPRCGVLAGWGFCAGAILFSGTLYAYSLTGVLGWVMLTPVGGTALLAGWACLLWGCWPGRGQGSDKA
jgi:uncharacterized membrane protein YgdD (TMEM256/DUF423 family)